MKKLILLVAAMALMISGGVAIAVDTATVTVSAIIPDTCRFTSPTAALSFGVLDQATAPAVSAGTNLSFWCTNGASYTITDDDGLYETAPNANRMRSTTLAVPEFIPYTLTYTPNAGTGLGPANPIALNITGNVAAGTYASNTADVYNDTVTLTINP
jgi:spore coat protein U-like protein